jgi:hypothetical protein
VAPKDALPKIAATAYETFEFITGLPRDFFSWTIAVLALYDLIFAGVAGESIEQGRHPTVTSTPSLMQMP